jgi:hypothetical protein
MWPAALIVGMFVLIGAIGTATAPTAYAAPGDVCDIQGPFPDFAGETDDDDANFDNNLLIEDNEYLFIVRVEGLAAGAAGGELGDSTIDVSIDDETGDADFTAYGEATGDASDGALVTVPGTDSIDLIDNWELTSYLPAFITDLEDDFDVDIDALTACEGTPSLDGLTILTVECDRAGTFEITAFTDLLTNNVITEEYECVNPPSDITLTASPATVESYPAIGNVSHSLILATVTDGDGHYVAEGYIVDWDTTACSIDGLTEEEYEDTARALFAAFAGSNSPGNAGAIELEYDGHGGLGSSTESEVFLHNPPGPTGLNSYAAAVLHCEGEDPGAATVTAEIDDEQEIGDINLGPSSDVTASVDVVIIGPPAFITMVAEPTELVCGEKSQILITVTDALNQNVSDHTRVELITNYGGVIGGTGSSLGFPGVNPVNPLSSSAAETFSGVATAYLLTSTNHIGSYEVVAAAGGSNLGGYNILVETAEDGEDIFYSGSTGVFSTAVITNQVTVVCSEGAPDVTAPDTGTGTISPPNTGDAGLAARSAGAASLFVIAGAVAFVLAGFASFSFARRS